MLNPTQCGTDVANYIKNNRPTGGPVTDGQLTALWQGIYGVEFQSIATNGRVKPNIPVTVDTGTGVGATTAEGMIE